MLVSVIIPVYNAERFVSEAVESALAQPETAEVLLIEDASLDNSLQVCEQLASEYCQAGLLRHADGKNHGAGASRSLGIESARYEYVAFLDADDYFLPGRFAVAKTLFEGDPELEGVYEAVGVQFEDRESEARWRGQGRELLTTMTERVAPEVLFERQSPIGSCGFCQTAGWVVKRSVFAKTGPFDKHLRLHQDTAMFVKLAGVGKMMPGRLDEPVAIRRVHAANRSSVVRPEGQVYRGRIRMWVALWRWGKQRLSESRQDLLLERFLCYASIPYRDPASFFGKGLLPWAQLTALALLCPDLVAEREFWLHYRRVALPLGLRKALVSLKARLLDAH
jgi:glycosyltransferase involved in cell wall biosynthesis